MASRDWRFIGGTATDKQRAFIDIISSKLGYSGTGYAANWMGYSSSKLSKRGLDKSDASAIIDALKAELDAKPKPWVAEDPEVQALRKDPTSEIAQLRKMAGIE